MHGLYIHNFPISAAAFDTCFPLFSFWGEESAGLIASTNVEALSFLQSTNRSFLLTYLLTYLLTDFWSNALFVRGPGSLCDYVMRDCLNARFSTIDGVSCML